MGVILNGNRAMRKKKNQRCPFTKDILVLHGRIMRERKEALTGHSHDHRSASICRGTRSEHEEEDARRLDCRKAERYLLKIREVGLDHDCPHNVPDLWTKRSR